MFNHPLPLQWGWIDSIVTKGICDIYMNVSPPWKSWTGTFFFLYHEVKISTDFENYQYIFKKKKKRKSMAERWISLIGGWLQLGNMFCWNRNSWQTWKPNYNYYTERWTTFYLQTHNTRTLTHFASLTTVPHDWNYCIIHSTRLQICVGER